MVSVSRGVAEPSSFLVVVADNGESIEKSSGLWRRAFVITVHQKGAPPETGQRGGAKFTKAKSWLKAGARGRRRREAGGVNISLDKGRGDESYSFARPGR